MNQQTLVASSYKKKNYRPIYENKETLAMENRFKTEFDEAFPKLELRKLPRSYNLDFAVFDKMKKQVLALVEYKERKYSYLQMDRMGGIKISLNKIKHALEYSSLFQVPCRLIYRLTDNENLEYYRFKVTQDLVNQCSVSFMEMYSRNDDQDVEPNLLIPMRLFEKKRLNG